MVFKVPFSLHLKITVKVSDYYMKGTNHSCRPKLMVSWHFSLQNLTAESCPSWQYPHPLIFSPSDFCLCYVRESSRWRTSVSTLTKSLLLKYLWEKSSANLQCWLIFNSQICSSLDHTTSRCVSGCIQIQPKMAWWPNWSSVPWNSHHSLWYASLPIYWVWVSSI